MIRFLRQFIELTAMMSEKEDGTMKIHPDNFDCKKNRISFFEKNGIDKDEVYSAEIINGNKVAVVDKNSERIISGSDCLVTKEKGVYLSITVADCAPVICYDKQAGILGLVHAGWRGITGGIISNCMNSMVKLGADSQNIYVVIGPGIDKCHFEIKEDVLDKFIGHEEFIIRKNGKIFVDLRGIIKKELESMGVKYKNIEDMQICTYEDERFFSFRRDKPKLVEAMIVIVGINN